MRNILLILPCIVAIGCPDPDPDAGVPSCEELSCQGGAVCLDGACRPRVCAELECPTGTVCQGGPLCVLETIAEDPLCSNVLCSDGYVCQSGPMCRDAGEDLDGDGVASHLDCDDGHELRFPGNAEVCDGIDNDCNGASDDEAPCREGYRCCGISGCIDPTNNRENCGACGQECEIYEECEESRCRVAESPVITAVTPDPLPTGIWLGRDEIENLMIDGAHLLGYATVYIESSDGSSTVDPFEVVTTPGGWSYTNDQPILIDGAQLPSGAAKLWLRRNDGEESNRFDINVAGAVPPEVTSASPDPLTLGEEITFSVYGSGFWGEPDMEISSDQVEWIPLPVHWVTETWVRTDLMVLDPSLHLPGEWSVVVRNPDELSSLPYTFEVAAAPAPVLTGIEPTEVGLGEEMTLSLFGNGFFGRPVIFIAPEADPEISILSPPLELVDERRLATEPFVVSSGLFSAQPYVVWVKNPDEASSNRVRFVVLE